MSKKPTGTSPVSPSVPVELVSESMTFTLQELCLRCGMEHQQLQQLVEFGTITPLARPRSGNNDWQFSADTLQLLAKAARMQQAFELDAAGLAISLELLDELQRTRRQVQKLSQLLAQHVPL